MSQYRSNDEEDDHNNGNL